MTIKPSYLRLYRHELERLLRKLNNSEIVLYLFLVAKADWDPRHEKTYSTVKMTIRDLGKHLPRSASTIHGTLTSLHKKRFVEKSRGVIKVCYLWAYTTKQGFVYGPEQDDELPQHLAPPTEQEVRAQEQADIWRRIADLKKLKQMPGGP